MPKHPCHPDPNGPPDLTPIVIGEILENPVTRERASTLATGR